MEGDAAGRETPAERRLLAVILLAAAAAFGAGLTGAFHFDDYTLFSDPVVTSGWGWWHVWRPLQTRPLTYFTFWLNYQLGGREAFGYHALNLGLHLIAVWLMYGVAARITNSKAALAAAAVFALHPVQTEPVVYVFGRAALIATVFCLLSLRSWIGGRYWPAAGWFALALLGKEECVAFPFLLLLIRRAWLPAVGMLCLSSAAGLRVIVALKALHVTGAGQGAGVSALDYFSTQGLVILRYLRLLLVPYGLTFDPDIQVVRDWRAWLAWAAIIGAAVLLWALHRHGKWFAAGLILLAPSSSIFPADDLAADRRLYLPMLAFAILGGLILSRIKQPVLAAIPIIVLALLSGSRTQVWRTEQSLWADAVQKAPRKLRPRILLARASEPAFALPILDVAKTIAPDDPKPALEKGIRLMELNLPEVALAEFDSALRLSPDNPAVLNNRGVARARLGRREAAIEDFRHALEADPCWERARRNLELAGAPYERRCEKPR